MTEADRLSLNALKCDAPELSDEAEHFVTCATCGQAFDLRNLGDLLYHEQEMHEPLPRD